jgi:hypothetical protein
MSWILNKLKWPCPTETWYRLHDMTESLLATHSFHIASLSLLGRMPPLHLLMVTLLFLPGQATARLLQLEAFHTLV